MSIRPSGPEQKPDPEAADAAVAEYNKNIDALNATIESNENLVVSNGEIIDSNTIMLSASVLVFVLGISFLFHRLLVPTHRIAGPIWVMMRDMQKMLDGEKPDFRDLRDMDDFKDFHQTLKQLAKNYQELEEIVSKKEGF